MSGFHLLLNITSNPGNVAKIQPFVERLVNRYNINTGTFGNILVSLTEAVTNAIRHGNLSDESKSVTVWMKKESDALTFSVSDEGAGFDYNNIPDPTFDENLLTIGGRGVFLMKELSDQVEFLENGSTVKMRFRI